MPINPELYDSYRPSYPDVVFQLLPSGFLERGQVVADIGSGTGLFSKMLLERGAKVHAVEPDPRMRRIAETKLEPYSDAIISLPGKAEQTGLDSSSVDLITVASAFQWFDVDSTRVEFQRILRKSRLVLILWNERMVQGTPFSRLYDDLRSKYFRPRIGPSFHALESSIIPSFFGTEEYQTERYPNIQRCDFERVWGIVSSSSYAPDQISERNNYEKMASDFKKLFEKCQQGGTVELAYETVAVVGRL